MGICNLAQKAIVKVYKMGIRNSAKAVLVKDGKVLAVRIHENGGTYYILPGGGQEHGENLHQAFRKVQRRVRCGSWNWRVDICTRIHWENHELGAYHSHAHQTEFMFLCSVNQDTFINGKSPDKGQIGTEWLPINELLEYKLFPLSLRTHLISYFASGKAKTYVGDIN